jgi:hypothetical protein
MKKVLGLLAGAALLLGASLALAQQIGGAQVGQQAQHYDAGVNVQSTAPAVNATQAAGTVTITPPSGSYVYFTSLLFGACGDGTASQSPIQLAFTSTNIGGASTTSLQVENSAISGSTITTNAWTNLCAWSPNIVSFAPLRSLVAGTPVTLIPPAQNAHVSFPIIAAYYFSP